MRLLLVVAILLFSIDTAATQEWCRCSQNRTCCTSTMESRVESFIDRYTRDVKKGDGRNNLFQMNIDVMSLAVLEVNWYIRGMLFNESEAYTDPYDVTLPVSRAERVEAARNVSQVVMRGFNSSMQSLPLDDLKSKRLQEYFQTLNSFLVGLYDELGKAMDDAVTKLSEGTVPSYHRQVCTVKIVDEQIGCELKKAAQVFVAACQQPEPSIVSLMRSTCEKEPNSGLSSTCLLDEALGPMYNYDQLFLVSDILRTRLFHLVFAYILCNGRYSPTPEKRPLASFPEEIYESFEAAFARAQQQYWPGAVIEMAKTVAEESSPQAYPREHNVRQYDDLAKRIAKKADEQWNPSDIVPNDDHEAFVYYNCDDCDMIADSKWLNVETVKHRNNKSGTANATKSQLGIAKHAGVNIVVSRGSGRQRNCWLVSDWNEVYSKIITNASGKAERSIFGSGKRKNSAALLEIIDEELSHGIGNPWRACFRAMLAIRCACRFVWLELSWKYYPATSDAPYKIDVYPGSFDSRCTRVVFIR